MFGLETEGLSQEDREFEVAKQFVRFGGDATQKARRSRRRARRRRAAKTAVQQAAERFVPGLVAGPSSAPGFGARHGRLPRQGTWVRQGSKIVINLPGLVDPWARRASLRGCSPRRRARC